MKGSAAIERARKVLEGELVPHDSHQGIHPCRRELLAPNELELKDSYKPVNV